MISSEYTNQVKTRILDWGADLAGVADTGPCRDACPAKAIKGISTADHYKDRDEAMHFSRCAEKLSNEYARLPDIAAPICGICIKACPFANRVKNKAEPCS